MEKASHAAEPLQAADRCACWAILWAAAGFVVFQFGVRMLIDYQWPQMRDPTFEVKVGQLRQILAKAPQPTDLVVMLGSSVTVGAFKARDVEDRLKRELGRSIVVANMANYGGGPLTELIWTRRLLERGLRPRLAVIEFSPQTFTHDRPIDAARFPECVLTEADLDVMERYSEDPDLCRNWRKARILPSYGHRLTILNVLAKPLVPRQDQVPAIADRMEERFWVEEQATTPEWRQERFAAAKEAGKVTFDPGKPSVSALEELLDMLDAEKIPAIVVRAPWGPIIRWRFPAEPVEHLTRHVVDLTRKHRIAYVNADEWLDESMFSDSMHVSRAGAEEFTARLTREAILPELARTGEVPSARQACR